MTVGERSWRRLGAMAVLALAAAVPFVATDFQLFKLAGVLVYAIALLGVNLLTGYNGQISLGHGAFYTLGAYTAAILMIYFAVPHWIALPIAGFACFAAGAIFALPVTRLEGMHLALATFALAVVTPQLANYKGVASWTGGSQGLGLSKLDVPFGLPLSRDQWVFLLALFVLALLFVLASNLLGGRIGRAIIAIRDHPIGAQSMGINTTYYKTLTFGISAMYTGVAGALSALLLSYASPASIYISLGFLIGSAVGGIVSLSGAIYGAIFLQVILFAAGAIAQSARTPAVLAIYGIVVIAFLHMMPDGVAGFVNRITGRVRRNAAAANLTLTPENPRVPD